MNDQPAESKAVTEPSAAPRGGLIGALLWPMRLLKRIYAWVVGWANTKWGLPALMTLSFLESSFFPIPPDPLLLALCLGNRRKALLYGAACTLASVAGGVLGWFIGRWSFGLVESVVHGVGAEASWFGTPESAAELTPEQRDALPRSGDTVFYPDGNFHAVQEKFRDNAFMAYFTAAFTPVPYKVFTIAGGLFDVSLFTLIVASVFGRGMRFMAIALLIFLFGDKVKPLLEKYFEWITVALCVLIVGFFIVLKYVL